MTKRENPGKLNLGAINPGSTQNLSVYLFQQVTGAEYTIVPYRTTPDLVTALLRGDVDMGFDFFAALQPVLAGSGRIEQRLPVLHLSSRVWHRHRHLVHSHPPSC